VYSDLRSSSARLSDAVASSSDKELFASGTASSDLLAKLFALSVVVRNFRPVLLRNVVMDGAEGVGFTDVDLGAFVVVEFKVVRVLPEK